MVRRHFAPASGLSASQVCFHGDRPELRITQQNAKPLGGLLAKGIFISTHVQTQPSVWVHGEPDLGYNN